MSLDLVVFDLDGTLVDSLPDIAAALNYALGKHGLSPLPQNVVETLVGDGILALCRRAVNVEHQRPGHEVTGEVLAETMWPHYLAHPCVHTRPYGEIVETLEALHQKGVAMAVMTNKPGNVARALLAALQMQHWFSAVIGDGDGFPRKPDPEALRSLISQHDADARRTLMVGDGVPDVQVAHAAGCVAVAALWGYSPRAVLLEQQPHNALLSPSQLLDLP